VSYPVSASDVAARWRPLSAAEIALADTLLEDLTNDLDVFRPTLADTLTAMADPDKTRLERAIVKTLANAVKRAMRNPDTLRSTNIGADGGIGVGYDNGWAALAATAAALTADDLRTIDRATIAGGGTVVSGVVSRQLLAHSERYASDSLAFLPTP
jgi:hypothetical protein